MKTIVITLPNPVADDEAAKITVMLRSGVIDRVHIRKPGLPSEEMRRLIAAIPSELHSRLSIHSHPQLLAEFPGIGWHFSEKRPEAEGSSLTSRSCHSPYEAAVWARKCDYVTLSPVFDSISKPDYHASCFCPVEEHLCNQKGVVVALGGVTPKHFPRLKERGYQGAAMLGYAWNTDINQLIEELKCYNS